MKIYKNRKDEEMKTIEQILNQLQQKKEQMEVIKRDILILESDLFLLTKEQISNAYKEKGNSYGVIHLDGFVVNTPKKVVWDQDKLAEIYQSISLSNEDPKDYIKITYDVSESKYNAWPESIRSSFDVARTVSPGKVTIKLGDE